MNIPEKVKEAAKMYIISKSNNFVMQCLNIVREGAIS